MIKIFRRWVRVKKVFISRRLNKWGKRSWFVRFFEMRNVGMTLQRSSLQTSKMGMGNWT